MSDGYFYLQLRICIAWATQICRRADRTVSYHCSASYLASITIAATYVHQSLSF